MKQDIFKFKLVINVLSALRVSLCFSSTVMLLLNSRDNIKFYSSSDVSWLFRLGPDSNHRFSASQRRIQGAGYSGYKAQH